MTSYAIFGIIRSVIRDEQKNLIKKIKKDDDKMNKEITWKQFNEVYGLGITEKTSYDVEIVPSKYGFEPKLKVDLFDDKRNTGYEFNIYNRETDNDVLSDWVANTIEEIIEIIIEEFNIVE